jgi:hypothetical protein
MRGDASSVGPFDGGLNTRDELQRIPQNQSPDCLNVIGAVDGSVRKRDPSTLFASGLTGAGVNDVSALFWAPTPGVFIATAGLKMYEIDQSGTVFDITGGAVFGTVSAPWSFIQAPTSGGQGPVYGLAADLTTSPQYWTGAGNIGTWTASAGTLDKGDYMIYFKNRVIMFGLLIGTNGTGIKASSPGDPRNWDTSAAGGAWLTSLDPYDGEIITAMGYVGSYVVAFKRSKAYLIYDLDTGANRLINDAPGCASRRSVVTTPHGLIYLATNGHVYITDGSKTERLSDVLSEPASVSALHTSTSLGINCNSDDTRTGNFLWSSAVFYNEKYYLSTCTATTNYRTYVFDFKTRSWWVWTEAFAQMIVAQFSNTVPRSELFGARRTPSGGTAASNIWNLWVPGKRSGAWVDPSGAYNAYWTTPPLTPGRGAGATTDIRRRYHAMRAQIAGTVDVQVALDQLSSIFSLVTYTSIGTVSGFELDNPVENSFYSMGVGNCIRFKFNSSSVNTTWLVYPFQIFTQSRTD